MSQNYLAVADALWLGRDEIVAIVCNGIKALLMSALEKDKSLAEVDRVLAESA